MQYHIHAHIIIQLINKSASIILLEPVSFLSKYFHTYSFPRRIIVIHHCLAIWIQITYISDQSIIIGQSSGSLLLAFIIIHHFIFITWFYPYVYSYIYTSHICEYSHILSIIYSKHLTYEVPHKWGHAIRIPLTIM